MKPSFRGTKRAIALTIVLISAFLTLMFALIWSYHIGTESNMSPIISPLVKYHIYFMISMGALGVAVGVSVFFLMSTKVESKEESAKKSSEVFMRFLSKDEKFVVLRLKQENGKMFQSHLSREPGMNRLKVHRVLAKLSEKGVITLDDYGKTNIVKLQKDILESLP